MHTPQDTGGLPPVSALKAQAKRLRAAMAAAGTPITHGKALETLAQQWGFRDWNTLNAAAQRDTPMIWQVGQRVKGRYLGHPVTGRLKAVRQEQGGHCHVTVVFDTAVDVVASDAFSAYRKQVNAHLNSDGVTAAKISDGTPHLQLQPA